MVRKADNSATLKDAHIEETNITWQAEKSAMTRKAVLDSAIRCFLKIGYTNTTTSKIAEDAGLSRGAMLHHFPSRDVLIEATVDHLNDIRIQDFTFRMMQIDPNDTDRVDSGIEAYWQHLLSDSFIVFHELIIASRSDKELEAILSPKIKAFERAWMQNTSRLFPEWEQTGEIFELAMDLTQYLMEGMAANSITMTHHQELRKQHLLSYLKGRLRDLFNAGLEGKVIEDTF